jgi:hypothetical protein
MYYSSAASAPTSPAPPTPSSPSSSSLTSLVPPIIKHFFKTFSLNLFTHFFFFFFSLFSLFTSGLFFSRNFRVHSNIFWVILYWHDILFLIKKKLQFDFFILFLLKNIEYYVSIKKLHKDTKRSYSILHFFLTQSLLSLFAL